MRNPDFIGVFCFVLNLIDNPVLNVYEKIAEWRMGIVSVS